MHKDNSTGRNFPNTTSNGVSNAAPTNTQRVDMLEAALSYHAAGLIVIPFWNDPDPKKQFPPWAKYRDGQTTEDVKKLFSKPCDRLAILTGIDGLEALDHDVKHDPTKTIYNDFVTEVGKWGALSDVLKKCVIVSTKSGGWHILYRAPNIEGNQKLTMRKGSPEAVIETRGVGGLLFVAPSPGYEVVQGSYLSIPTITEQERNDLIFVARLLSHREETVNNTGRPGDEFNENHSILELLEPKGWTFLYDRNGITYLNRPGAPHKGVSAAILQTVNGERFFPFTTSTHYTANQSYSAFAVYAHEEHRGDYKAAAKALAPQMNGTPSGSTPGSSSQSDGGVKGSTAGNGSQSDGAPKVGILEKLKKSNEQIIKAAAQDIVFTPAWIKFEDAPIFSRGTINVIQGKAGVHKSRLAETLCALLLASINSNRDFLGFTKHIFGAGFCVGYIDTERNTQEHFPAAVQRIRERAGLDKRTDNGKFFPVSIKGIDRRERLEAVKAWITHIRETMPAKNWNLFIVLDVVTDCVASFNRDDESLALFDYLGRLCEDEGVTFLLVLHENPGSDKARGHTGTEAMNKADTQIQIGYDAGPGEDTDLIKVRFLKTRNAARPKPLYLQFSKEENGLVLADESEVNSHLERKKKKKDHTILVDRLMQIFDKCDEISQKDLLKELADLWSENTLKEKLGMVITEKLPIQTKDGKKCLLAKTTTPGKYSMYFLDPLTTPKEAPESSLQTDDDYSVLESDDCPF